MKSSFGIKKISFAVITLLLLLTGGWYALLYMSMHTPERKAEMHRSTISHSMRQLRDFSRALELIRNREGAYPESISSEEGYCIPSVYKKSSNEYISDEVIKDDIYVYYFGNNTILRKPCKSILGGSQHRVQYISNKRWYVLVSCGPDGKYEQKAMEEFWRARDTVTSETFNRFRIGIEYDPSNGTKSRGDFVVTSPNLGYDILGLEKDSKGETKLDRLKGRYMGYKR